MRCRRFAIVLGLAVLGAAGVVLSPDGNGLYAQGPAHGAGSIYVVWPRWFSDDGGGRLMGELGEAFAKSHPETKAQLAFHADDFASVGRFADSDAPFGVLVQCAADRQAE